MSLRFCVLGSGSSGNASYLEADGYGLLLDAGLGPRRLAKGLAAAGASWDCVRAVVLTHTHGDHWHEITFKHMVRRRIPIHCHPRHLANLQRFSQHFHDLLAAELVHTYDTQQPVTLGPMRGIPFPVPHDDAPTCGFRFECAEGAWALGYAADLGSWSDAVVSQLRDVDILAVEFNHDVAMERRSGRSPMLIDRVLGDHGHLSNDQGAALVTEVLRRSASGRVQHLVLLHLSQQCNHPRLAHAAAIAAIKRHGREIRIHAARHNSVGPVLTTNGRTRSTPADAEILLF